MALVVHAGGRKLQGRQELLNVVTPEGTATHRPIPHDVFVDRIIQALAYRHIDVVKDEYALAKDGARMFGFLELNVVRDGVSLLMGIRNSHDRSFASAIVAGFKVFVCDNLALSGEFEALKLKHSAKFLEKIDEAITIGVDRTQRRFDTVFEGINVWKNHSLPDHQARALIYDAFIEGKLEAPARLAEDVHKHYFEPPHAEFEPRNLWSLHNAFTEAFKQLVPESFVKANISLGEWFPTPNNVRFNSTPVIEGEVIDDPENR